MKNVHKLRWLLWVQIFFYYKVHAKSGINVTDVHDIGRAKRQTSGMSGNPLGGYCPSRSEVPFINPSNGVAQGCPASFGCPPGYQCQRSTTYQDLCCGTIGQVMSGGGLYQDQNGRSVSCTPEFGSCPYGAQCVPTSGGPMGQYVCTQGGGPITNGCPYGTAPQIRNGQIQFCQAGYASSGCTPPYSCYPTGNSGQGICCSPSSPSTDCPGGQRVLVLDGDTQTCGQVGVDCPELGYTCQPSILSKGKLVCCGMGDVNPYFCDDGSQPYMLGVEPFYCTPQALNCPRTYSCRQAKLVNNRYVCCESGGGPSLRCPNGGEVQGTYACDPTDRQSCPSATQCREVASNTYRCCSSGEVTCPSGKQPVSSESCSLSGQETCPTGSSCSRTSDGGTGCCATDSKEPGSCPNNAENDGQGSCDPDQSVPCGSGFDCTRTSNGVYACCKKSSSGGNPRECANGQLPDIQGGSPRSCNPNNPSCRQGYMCSDNGDHSGTICCRGPRCPGGVTTGGGPDGQPINCQSDGDCPSGQSCKQAINLPSFRICCQPGRSRRFL